MKKLKLLLISVIILLFPSLVFTANRTISNKTYENLDEVAVTVFGEYDNLTLNKCNFLSNTTDRPNGEAGAIYVSVGKLTANSTNFNKNKATNGGAIYNTYGRVSLVSSIFNNNSATNSGGALYLLMHNDSWGSVATIKSSDFDGNKATKNGGAIYIYNEEGKTTNINSSIFNKNTAGNVGGAIFNSRGSLVINSSDFIENKARLGGAIDNNEYTILTINSSSFNGNIATSKGGAIYNLGTLNLLANTKNIEFTGNIANGVSNAIHNVVGDNYTGRINMYASNTSNIIFNDRITGNGNIYINRSTTTINPIGKVILNENMSGYTGNVNLYGGEIELQAKTEEGSNVNTNKFFSGDINLSSGTLNILNNSIDNITVTNLTTTSNTNLKFDTDLSNNTSDNFTITNNASGELNLTAINILGVDEKLGQITLFNNGKAPTLNILTNASYGGYEYNFTNSGLAGVLNYERGAKLDLKNAVNKTEPTIRSYSLAENELVTEDLGQLGGEQLTIFGNGYEVYPAKFKSRNNRRKWANIKH